MKPMDMAEIERMRADIALCRDAGITRVPIPLALLERMLDAIERSLAR